MHDPITHIPEWMSEGLCAQVDPELFFPEVGSQDTAANAKKVCAACPVTGECLAYALEHNERDGIWGGTTPYARKGMRRRPITSSFVHGTEAGAQSHRRRNETPCDECRLARNAAKRRWKAAAQARRAAA